MWLCVVCGCVLSVCGFESLVVCRGGVPVGWGCVRFRADMLVCLLRACMGDGRVFWSIRALIFVGMQVLARGWGWEGGRGLCDDRKRCCLFMCDVYGGGDGGGGDGDGDGSGNSGGDSV